MPASTIFRLARTIRCAMVASLVRKARAISGVVSPITARRVSATCASRLSAGWQQVKISRSRSSCSPLTSWLDDATARPALGDSDRLIQVGDIEDAVSPDGFLGFGERSVGDDRLPAIQLHGGGSVHRLQLVAIDDLAFSAELAPPLADPAEDLLLLCLGDAFPGPLLADQQHHVLHACPPCGLPALILPIRRMGRRQNRQRPAQLLRL